MIMAVVLVVIMPAALSSRFCTTSCKCSSCHFLCRYSDADPARDFVHHRAHAATDSPPCGATGAIFAAVVAGVVRTQHAAMCHPHNTHVPCASKTFDPCPMTLVL